MPLDSAIAPADLAVLLAYLVGIVLFGIWVGRGQRNVTDYLLGGRDLPWWAILGSIVATETSTVTFLSVPGLAFAARQPGTTVLDPRVGGDLRFLQLACGLLVGRCLIVYFLLPLFFRGQLFSAYEVLQYRFGGATKRVASLVFLLTRNIGDGLRLFLTAIVLAAMIDLPLAWCVVVIGVSTIIYTFTGGIKSVIWSDCIQFVIYIGGAILALAVILYRLPGGWWECVSFAQDTGKFRILDSSCDLRLNFTVWSGIIGGAFLALGTHGTDQMMVQRYLCARRQRDAGVALIASGVVVIVQFALFLLLGVALACFYAHVRPTVSFDSTDRVLSRFIVEELPAGWGLIGVILAAVFAAAMSTLSGSLNSSASAAVHDFYLPWRRAAVSERHLLWVSRGCTVLFGIIQIGIGIVAQYFATAVVNDVLAIASFAAGLLLGVFALGVFTRRVGQRAALAGLVTGLLVLTWVKFGTPVAYTWYGVIGATTTFAAGLLASYCWAGSQGGGSTSSLDESETA
ncbi:MAG: sodium/solute symporter [Planctomycetaceae bacterium]|nr:sodium/solute symporter [Planctomycetaceae bacterium]